jgi:neopullulanase
MGTQETELKSPRFKWRLRPIALLAILIGLCLFAAASESLAATSADAEPMVTKVEPPSWWANHSINPVRLLVRGTNLTGARVRSTRPEVLTSNIRINARGTYLFVNLNISRLAKPGNYPLLVETPRGSAAIQFRIDPPLAAATHFQGISNDDVIYLIMTDRFSDGDSSNNAPARSPAEANNRHNARAYHGGDLRGVINQLSYFKELGVTALWLTPWYDNWNGVNNCDKPWCPNTYYHGYHAIDYYAVEDHFGDLATLRELVEKAHALGIKIVQDQVANHVGSQHPWVKDSPLDNWFHGTLASHAVNKFRNSALLSPHANRDEFRNTLDGWFSDDLPDMNQEEPEVARYEIQNALWWIGVTGLDAIRQDTIQYMPRFFIRDLSNALQRQYPKLWMVGEVFERDAAHTSYFIGGHLGWDKIDTRLDSVFDFPVWNSSLLAFTNKAPLRTLRDQLKYDALYPDPQRITTFANNHDTMRFMSLEGASLDGAMMHVAFTLSIRGTPQLYYGEEIAMEGKDDPDNRRDFPGGFPGDSRNAFVATGRSREQQRMWEWTRDWIKLRRDHAALRVGRLIDLYSDDDAYVFARQNERETVLVAFNRTTSDKKVVLPLAAIGFVDSIQLMPLYAASASRSVAKGEATLVLPPRTAVAYSVK